MLYQYQVRRSYLGLVWPSRALRLRSFRPRISLCVGSWAWMGADKGKPAVSRLGMFQKSKRSFALAMLYMVVPYYTYSYLLRISSEIRSCPYEHVFSNAPEQSACHTRHTSHAQRKRSTRTTTAVVNGGDGIDDQALPDLVGYSRIFLSYTQSTCSRRTCAIVHRTWYIPCTWYTAVLVPLTVLEP